MSNPVKPLHLFRLHTFLVCGRCGLLSGISLCVGSGRLAAVRSRAPSSLASLSSLSGDSSFPVSSSLMVSVALIT